jgi:hypothetical protein
MHPGNTIKVCGGLAKQREIVVGVITHCIEQLLPRHRTLWIEAEFKDLSKDDVLGYCYQTDHNMYTLELEKYQIVYDLITTACHEMVHVKQGVRGELTEKHLRQYWKGEAVKSVLTTNHLGPKAPWEREAWDKQHPLAHSYIRNTGNRVKAVKAVEERCMELY